MLLSDNGKKLIKQFEGCGKKRPDGRFSSYPDPGSSDGKPWTIGYGSTGPDVVPGLIWTQAQCDVHFDTDILRYEHEVNLMVGDHPTTQNQFDALVSFQYNTGALSKSHLLVYHNQGEFDLAADEFGKWIYNNHKPMQGLKNRRAMEADLYRNK